MAMKPNMEVNIGGIRMQNPVMCASGTFSLDYAKLIDLKRLGAIVPKSITLESRTGNPSPRIVETPCGMLNSIGLQNDGVENFVTNDLPSLIEIGIPVIPSIAGEKVEEYGELAGRLDREPGIAGLEINISCPNIEQGGMTFGVDAKATQEVVTRVRQATKLPLIVKLTPNVTDITVIAKAAEEAGADAISLINTFRGMAIDIETRRPVLGGITGGLSGKAIHPLAVYLVWRVAQSVKVPVIGIGGIANWKDAIEFIIVGATAVGVGTATFVNPRAMIEIIDGIEGYLKHEIGDINELVGTFRLNKAENRS